MGFPYPVFRTARRQGERETGLGTLVRRSVLMLILGAVVLLSAAALPGAETTPVFAQGGVIRFFDDLEDGGLGWNNEGFWRVVTDPADISVHPDINPPLVSLPDAGALPGAYSGRRALWYGEPCTGTYIGCDFRDYSQTPKNGGRSTVKNAGTAASPGIDLTGVTRAYLEFKTWWEIEGVDVSSFDIMAVHAVTAEGGKELGRLNPVNDVNGERFRPFSSGGLGQPGRWTTVRVDLSEYAGQEVHVVFRFDTRDPRYNGFRGWLIDDIKVVATALAAPEIEDVTPQFAQAGSFITIHGANFVSGATVSIGGKAATDVAVLSTDEVQAKVPTLPVGSYEIVVRNPDGQQDMFDGFGVTDTPAPSLISIEPNSGSADEVVPVVISGENFHDGAKVFIATTELANIAVISDTRIEADVPKGLPGGNQNVRVVNPDGQSDLLHGGFAVHAVVNPITASADGQTFTPGADGVTRVRIGAFRRINISVPVDCGVDEDGNPKPVLRVTAFLAGGSWPLFGSSSGGVWSGTIEAVGGGEVWIEVECGCPDGSTKTSRRKVMDVELIDPSGYIYDLTNNKRVPGATATLFYKDPTQGDIVWDAKKYNQINPQTSNGEGRYGWDVPAGDYYVVVTHPCYFDVTSKVVTIPPPVTDLHIGLQPTGECNLLVLPLIFKRNPVIVTVPTATHTPAPPTATPTIAPPTATPTTGPTATPTTSPVSGIHGRVTRGGAPAAGIQLDLDFWNGSDWSTSATISTTLDGVYQFNGAPGLGSGQLYTVHYRNTPTNPNPGSGNLWSWFGDRIDSYTAGQTLPGGDFDIVDLPLVSPADNATLTLPAEFCWTPRGVAGDNYQLRVYNPTTDSSASTNYLGSNDCVTITGMPSGWQSGETLTWWVRVYKGSDPDATRYNFGDSYGDRKVKINFSAGAAAAGGVLLQESAGGGR